MNINIEPTQVGVAGEYLVASELSLRGYIAAITLRNTRGTDIIASTKDGMTSVSIQVKANSKGKRDWLVGQKAEDFCSPSHYYAFVTFRRLNERAKFYIVPSEIVAQTVTESHEEWMKGKKKDGGERKDTSMRHFKLPENSHYEDAWESIFTQLDSANASDSDSANQNRPVSIR